jgi:hypothetical protein
MVRKLLIVISTIVLIISIFKSSWAYDGTVHSIINENVAKEASQLDSVLKTQLGISEGRNTEIKKDNEKKQIWEWIAYGGKAEDYGMKLGEWDIPTRSRAFNHFHDPLKSWDEAGLDNMINVFYWGNYLRSPVSSILWGLKPDEQNFLLNLRGDWSWGKAKEYYFVYLTGRDFEGNMVASMDDERKEYFSDCLRGLGQVMHLLQDVSVPLHTRNDVHILPLLGVGEKSYGTYETYTKNNKNNLDYTPDQPGDRPSSDLLTSPQPDSNYTQLAPITGLFDRNQYNEGDDIPSINAAIGLAEYSNANFLTEDTMWKYPHPSLNDTNYDSSIWLNPEEVDAEDGEKDNRIYFRKDAGDPIDHIMAASYWYYQLYIWNSPELKHAFILDDKCYADYASKLVPRAVGYSAALLDYFFRGRLEVSALPIFVDNAIYGIRMKIKNVTPTEETMTMGDEGLFALVCRYTPAGGKDDGSEDIFVASDAYFCQEGNCDEIQYGDEVTVDFSFPMEEENRIGMQIVKSAEKSVKCMLVFKGKLGQEESAVIGKYFTFGQDQVKFNEEWDNGFTGNHPWFNSYTINPNNGTSSNIVENGILSMDNTRFLGYKSGRYNESYLDFDNPENPSGMLISPDSYLEFKIDDMSIDASNPDVHWQALTLVFNDEILIQFSQEGQNNYNDYAFRFNPGENTVVNIYSLFEAYGIEIPNQLHLTFIGLIQQFYDVENPPGIRENQHMEVDNIRIIEEKHED